MLLDSINRPDFCILTNRLVLRPASPEYAAAYFEEFSEEIARYQFPAPFENLEAARAFLLEAQAQRELGEELVCTIFRAHGEFLGSAEMRNISSPTPEAGLWLKKTAQGMGYGKETMEAFLRFFRENGQIDFFVYETDRRNLASMKLIKALGGECEAAYDVEGALGKLLRLKLFYIQ